MNFKKLSRNFYLRTDLLKVTQELLGKILMTKVNGEITGGMITEVEAYYGVTDKASHAFAGRRTARNEMMYAGGGTAYVYKCYGIHNLFNVVTNKRNIPHAILNRGIEPIVGIKLMMERRGAKKLEPRTSSGPGSLTVALGIEMDHNGEDLLGNKIWIEDHKISGKKTSSSKRIGVESAGKDALLNYRFYISNNPFVSKR
ncbi:MAG TPA: DNA-3-methyladenine glycosylase [Bacteroidetes bacterium]|nr:DNA-3-methyladenine glycosylase [Bacteroidota bacterium]